MNPESIKRGSTLYPIVKRSAEIGLIVLGILNLPQDIETAAKNWESGVDYIVDGLAAGWSSKPRSAYCETDNFAFVREGSRGLPIQYPPFDGMSANVASSTSNTYVISMGTSQYNFSIGDHIPV